MDFLPLAAKAHQVFVNHFNLLRDEPSVKHQVEENTRGERGRAWKLRGALL
jgi:hypothetical protein